MRSGDVVRIDFGEPVGSEPGSVRPAVVVTADGVLTDAARTVHVVPVTSDVARGLPAEVPVDAPGLERRSVAAAHLVQTVSTQRVVERGLGNVGPAALAQIRVVLADLLDVP